MNPLGASIVDGISADELRAEESACDRRPWSSLKSPQREDALLFACTRQEFQSRHEEWAHKIITGHDLDWRRVAATAIEHGVAPLVWQNLQVCEAAANCVPADMAARLDECTRKNVLFKGLVDERIRRLLSFFAERCVACLLVKGAALDRVVYRQAWFTTSADVDLVIGCRPRDLHPDDLAEANRLLAGTNALERLVPIESEWQRHHDLTLNGMLPIDFAELWRAARAIDCGGSEAFVMGHEDLLLSACVNSCRKRFFRLKALLDVCEIARSLPIDWDLLVERARRWQCSAIVYAALSAARLTLGCPVPAGAFQQLGLPRWRRSIVDYLARRMSFCSLATLFAGRRLAGRHVGPGLWLPYATYGLRQMARSAHWGNDRGR